MFFNFDITNHDYRRLYALGDFIKALALIAESKASVVAMEDRKLSDSENEAYELAARVREYLNSSAACEATRSIAAPVDETIKKLIADTEEKPKRARRTKAEIEAANASAGESAAAAAPDSASTEAASTSSAAISASLSDNIDDLFGETSTYDSEWAVFQAANEGATEEKFKRDLLQRVVAKVGMDSARGLMLSLGAKNVSEVTGDKRQAFFEKVSEILA